MLFERRLVLALSAYALAFGRASLAERDGSVHPALPG